jgi:hypothetical protein
MNTDLDAGQAMKICRPTNDDSGRLEVAWLLPVASRDQKNSERGAIGGNR